MCKPQIRTEQRAAISREHMIVIICNRSRESETALLRKKTGPRIAGLFEFMCAY
jgi:hypothetical protein